MYLLQTDINSITGEPNMRYAETAGKVFSRKSDYVNSIVRACARKLQESCDAGVTSLFCSGLFVGICLLHT